jgi:hypothetical protein
MVKKIHIATLLFWLSVSSGYAQQLISYVSINHNEAYIGQPIQMTVSVYTSTWFTTGIDVGNIQIEGALTVYFRSVTNTKAFSGKNFAGVDFIYNIFPTKAGKLTIQPLTINVESPKPGDYKGLKHVITTKPKEVVVKEVPAGYNPNNWLVSSTLNISEKWNTPLNSVKVGDVLQRTITRSAGGTLGEFIPEILWDTVSGISIYPKRPFINTNKSKTAVSASRTESANYLFEKEGKITLPQIEFVYWNYANRKFYKKVIDSVTITVAPNADLKMLASIKKDLEKETEVAVAEEKPFLIFGMTLKDFALALLVLIISTIVLFKFLKWLYQYIKSTYNNYLHSEKYAFKKVLQSLHKQDSESFYSNLKKWILQLNIKEKTMDSYLEKFGSDALKESYNALQQIVFKEEKSVKSFDYQSLAKNIKISRKEYFKQIDSAKVSNKSSKSLNPVS